MMFCYVKEIVPFWVYVIVSLDVEYEFRCWSLIPNWLVGNST